MIATVVISVALALACLAIVIREIRKFKKGDFSCSCGGSCGSCGSCGMRGTCHGASSEDSRGEPQRTVGESDGQK